MKEKNISFLLEKKIEKFEKYAANLHYKTEYVIHIRNLKQALNLGLVFKKVHRVIKSNQETLLKPYIDMKIKNDFEKDLFKLTNNALFGKTMKNVRKHRDIKLVTTERKTIYLVSKPNYHTKRFFTEHLLAIKLKKKKNTKKTKMLMNKPAYLGLSILELSKILIYEFWYDYVKPKCGEKAKLCYVDTDFIVSLYT